MFLQRIAIQIVNKLKNKVAGYHIDLDRNLLLIFICKSKFVEFLFIYKMNICMIWMF